MLQHYVTVKKLRPMKTTTKSRRAFPPRPGLLPVVKLMLASRLSPALVRPARADRESLKLMPRGGSELTRLRAQELALTATRPSNIKRVPKGLKSAYYATIRLGPREAPSLFTLLVDAPEGRVSRLFVDANGNGDFLDDPAPEWTHKTYAGRESDHLLLSLGGATLQVRYGKRLVPMHVSLSRFDTSEPARAALFQPIYCTADYAREGSVHLGGKAYHVWLEDALTRGDFRGSRIPGRSGIFLLIDVNGNGKIDTRGEIYDVSEPFNIGGVTYEASNIDAEGAAIELRKSTREVAEVLPPPDLAVGKLALPFEATTTSGQSIKFPDDYKKRLVLLYFWATWCGDCNRETPNVTRAYAIYHSRGLDILGISLDHKNEGAQLAAYTHEHDMEWPQIFDGGVWDARIVQLYFVTHTPTALLIDGTTGRILAQGSDLMGDSLDATIGKNMSER
jgi:peroxiredoxin